MRQSPKCQNEADLKPISAKLGLVDRPTRTLLLAYSASVVLSFGCITPALLSKGAHLSGYEDPGLFIAGFGVLMTTGLYAGFLWRWPALRRRPIWAFLAGVIAPMLPFAGFQILQWAGLPF